MNGGEVPRSQHSAAASTEMDTARPVVIFDFDNTLFDNDGLKGSIDIELRIVIGKKRAERFWELYTDVRKAQGYVDYPRTAERWAREVRVLCLVNLPLPPYVRHGEVTDPRLYRLVYACAC